MRQSPELYLPATDRQLRDFSNRLQAIHTRLGRLAQNTACVEIDSRLWFAAGAGWATIYFSSDPNDESVQDYTLFIARGLPFDDEWSDEAVRMLIGDPESEEDDEKELTYHGVSDEKTSDKDNEVAVPDAFDTNASRGCLEIKTTLHIERGFRAINATRNVAVSYMDRMLKLRGLENIVDPYVDHSPHPKDLQLLIDFGEIMLDTEIRERDLYVPTAADLIMGAQALMGVGLLSARATAFTGADPYMHMPLLSGYLY